MNNILINDIYIDDYKLIINSPNNIDTISFKSSNIVLKENIKDNTLNLYEVIEKNRFFIEDTSLFLICSEEDELIVCTPKIKGKDYITKNIRLKLDDEQYYIDVYINNKNQIKVKIKRKINLENDILIESIGINRDNTKLDLYLSCENFEYAQLLLYNRDLEYLNVDCIEKDGYMYFQIDLKKLIKKDQTLNAIIIVDKKRRVVKLREQIKLRKIMVQDGSIIKNILVYTDDKTNRLVIKSDGQIKIAPKIELVKYSEDTLVLNGVLNTNMNIHLNSAFKAIIRIISRDKSVVIEDDLDITLDRFKYNITKNELFNLKDAFSGEWDLEVEVSLGEDINVVEKLSYNNTEQENILKEIIQEYGNHCIVEAYLTKNKKTFALKLKNKVSITQILSMKVNKNNLIVKFRTKENVEKLLDTKSLVTNLENNKEKLVCTKVNKIGKKTYEGYYTSKDLISFINETLERGLTLHTDIKGTIYSQEMKEVNKYAIYYNKWEAIQNSKRYKKICSVLYNKLFLKLPIKKKRVLFESFLGRNVSGNPKYIYNYMVENNMDKEYELVWILNDKDEEIIGNGKKVKRKTLKYYYYMATSGYWVFNARQADEIIKRKNITYLQTWHGTPLKRLASDMESVDMGGVTDINEYKEKFFRNTKRWDYLLAQNDYSDKIFRRAFNFNKEIIYGYPANDILYKQNNKNSINKIKDRLGIPKDKKVIIYAPTWRDDNFYKKGHYKMSLELELDKMQEVLGDEYIILIRAHYLIANSINIADYKGFVYDFSQGYDIQELYLVSDILITDYSSVMFDYANLDRPMIFFTYDLEKYRDSLRGFYFDFKEEAPGPLVKTTDEVIECIKNINQINKEYRNKRNEFYRKFCHIDKGDSAKHVIDKVFN